MSSLVAKFGSPGEVNGKVFNLLGAKIRGKSKLPVGRRIIVFSPHPDDDVISMGGILRKLVENDNEIIVAYMTSGNIAVFDHDVRRYVDFLERLAAEGLIDQPKVQCARRRPCTSACNARRPGEVDVAEVQDIKRILREAEAVSGIETVGLPRSAARFLDLPFYQTGKVRKDPIGPADVAIVRATARGIQTGADLRRRRSVRSARHASHVQGSDRPRCASSDRRSGQDIEYRFAGRQAGSPEVWLYRGAWQEWPIHEATWLVPLSQEELRLKIQAIFKHQSQKDSAPFPGGYDEREFWQRVEARNKGTAAPAAIGLGLAEYFAMEALSSSK